MRGVTDGIVLSRWSSINNGDGCICVVSVVKTFPPRHSPVLNFTAKHWIRQPTQSGHSFCCVIIYLVKKGRILNLLYCYRKSRRDGIKGQKWAVGQTGCLKQKECITNSTGLEIIAEPTVVRALTIQTILLQKEPEPNSLTLKQTTSPAPLSTDSILSMFHFTVSLIGQN